MNFGEAVPYLNLKILKQFFFTYTCVCVNVCTGSPGVVSSICGCWKLKWGALEDQEVRLTSGPLSVPVFNFFLQCFAIFIV